MSAALFEYLATSSMATARPRIPPPEPPYSVGITSPRRPASRKISKRSWGYSFDWRHVLDAFARDQRVVLVDLLGYGLSAKPDQAYSLFEQADIVEALARELGLDEVALVTHDMGDSVGGELLARSLDRTLPFG